MEKKTSISMYLNRIENENEIERKQCSLNAEKNAREK